MSKVMQREMTVTTCKVAKTIIGEGGFPALEPLEDQIILGAVTQSQAEKIVKERLAKIYSNASYGQEGNNEAPETIDGIVVFNLESTTNIYELPVETFFKYATIQVQLTDEEKAAKKKADAIASAEKSLTRSNELLEKAIKKESDLDAEIVVVTNSIASASSDDLKKLEDKLSVLHERKVKATAKVADRQKEVATATKELSKLQN